MEYDIAVATCLKNARLHSKKTQQFVADQLGLSRPSVANWELGKTFMNAGDMYRYLDAIGYDKKRFFLEVDEMVEKPERKRNETHRKG
jgi:transcriptional regulator with XRE-family HTH domain